MMDTWERSAANLIAHYHATFQGTLPFSPNWLESVQEGAGIDAQAAEYLQGMESIVKSRGTPYLKSILGPRPDSGLAEELRIRANGSLGDPLVWFSQLFLPHPQL